MESAVVMLSWGLVSSSRKCFGFLQFISSLLVYLQWFQSFSVAIEQAALKAAIKSALDDMLDTKLAFLLNMKLEPLRSLMDFISNGFDEVKNKIAALENTNAELAKGNQFLRQENARVSNALNQMKSAYEQEQYIRRDCLEIRGVPTSSGEVTNEIVKKVGSIVDVCIEDTDISISQRIKSDSAIPPIIVKFIRRRVRDDLYKPRSKLKNLTIDDIGLGRPADNKIFIQKA